MTVKNGRRRTRVMGTFTALVLVLAVGAGIEPGTAGEVTFTNGPASFESLLRDANPDLADLGTITVWTPDGPETETVSGYELLDRMELLASANTPSQDFPMSHEGPHVGLGDMRVAPHTGWYFCDYASLWVWHSGEPGDRILNAEPAPVSPPTPPVCDGIFGPSTLWTQVTLDLTQDPAYNPGCGAAMIMLPHTDQPASPYGGWVCTGSHGTAAGFGHVISFGWAGRSMDHFIGGTASIVIE